MSEHLKSIGFYLPPHPDAHRMTADELVTLTVIRSVSRNGIIHRREDRVHLRPLFGQDYRKPAGWKENEHDEPLPQIEIPPAVHDFCAEIRRNGGHALLIGGFVRDVLINHFHNAGLQSKDIDIEVSGIEAQRLSEIIAVQFGSQNMDLVGASFGVIKVLVEGLDEPLDISITRRESSSGDGHRDFVIKGDPTMSNSEAARRRDLTINTLAYDPAERYYYDPFDGMNDIKNRMIRVTDPQTFVEDPLRVLRVFQFSARFGFSVDNQTQNLCRTMITGGNLTENVVLQPLLDTLPAERVWGELEKLLMKADRPSIGLRLAEHTGLIQRFWPELHTMKGIQQDPDWHPEGDVWEHTLQVVDAAADIAKHAQLPKDDRLVLMLSALLHDAGKPATTEHKEGTWRAHGHEAAGVGPAQAFMQRLKVPVNTQKQVLGLIPDHMSLPQLFNNQLQGYNQDTPMRRLSFRLGRADCTIVMLLHLTAADKRGRNGDGSSVPLGPEQTDGLSALQHWTRETVARLSIGSGAPNPLIKGRDIMTTLGIEQGGVYVGIITDILYYYQLQGSITDVSTAQQTIASLYEQINTYVTNTAQQRRLNENTVWKELAASKNQEGGIEQIIALLGQQ